MRRQIGPFLALAWAIFGPNAMGCFGELEASGVPFDRQVARMSAAERSASGPTLHARLDTFFGAARGGPPATRRAAFDAVAPLIVAIAWHEIGRTVAKSDRTAALDLLQQVLLSMWKAQPPSTGSPNWPGYVRRSARNAAASWLKERSRPFRRAEVLVPRVETPARESAALVELMRARGEIELPRFMKELRDAIARAPGLTARIVTARVFDGEEYSVIAAREHLTEVNARQHYHRWLRSFGETIRRLDLSAGVPLR